MRKMRNLVFIAVWMLFFNHCFVHSKRDTSCWFTFSSTEANAFLSNGQRSTPKECCDESQCESRGSQCYTEQYRQFILNSYGHRQHCAANERVQVISWCPGHYSFQCSDICKVLGKPRCENGGTCISSGNSWHCLCKPGYTGVICAIDIDECASSPCQNGATCTDYVNFFKCHCPPGFYGTLCDTGICRPLPADVVFILDSSVSMTESQFKKQLEFVSNFTDEITVGHRDFQISVITYSWDAHIEFYLNQYIDNVTLKEAIANITYKPGATFTHLGLEAVKTVFGPGHGGDVPRYNSTLADRLVYLLTDGMSNDRRSSVQVANSLKQDLGVTISAIGIGVQVSHQELYDIASKRDVSGTTISSVYSVNNFNSLYTVLKELVHVTCEECSVSKKSDVIIVMQTTSKMSDMQVLLSKNALTYLLQRAELGENKTKISLLTYDTNINTEFDFDKYNRSLEMLATINQVSQSSANSEIGVDAVLKYTQEHVIPTGRPDARSFILFVGNAWPTLSCKSNPVTVI